MAEKKTLVDSWLARVKNNPVVAVLVFAFVVVGGVAQFTDAVGKIADILPLFEPARPDLRICEIDLEQHRVDVCNNGDAPAPTKDLYLAISERWYVKPAWNSELLIGSLKYVENREIPRQTKLTVRVPGLEHAEPGTELMIDSQDLVREQDETNNCVKADGTPVSCRPIEPFPELNPDFPDELNE